MKESSFITDFLPSIISAVIALIVVYLAHCFVKIREKNKDLNERKNKFIYIQTLIKNLNENVSENIKNVENFSQKINNKTYQVSSPVSQITGSNSILKEDFRSQRLFSWHYQKYGESKIKCFVQLSECFTFYEIQLNEYLGIGSKARNFVYDTKKEITDKSLGLDIKLKQIYDEKLPQSFIDEYEELIDVSNTKITDEQNYGQIKEHYYLPLDKLLRKYQNNRVVSDCLDILRAIFIHFKILDSYLKSIYKDVTRIKNDLIDMQDKIIENSEHFVS